jgi:hypothetical protein
MCCTYPLLSKKTGSIFVTVPGTAPAICQCQDFVDMSRLYTQIWHVTQYPDNDYTVQHMGHALLPYVSCTVSECVIYCVCKCHAPFTNASCITSECASVCVIHCLCPCHALCQHLWLMHHLCICPALPLYPSCTVSIGLTHWFKCQILLCKYNAPFPYVSYVASVCATNWVCTCYPLFQNSMYLSTTYLCMGIHRICTCHAPFLSASWTASVCGLHCNCMYMSCTTPALLLQCVPYVLCIVSAHVMHWLCTYMFRFCIENAALHYIVYIK